MTFTGGLGERYCSQKCYDAGGATVTKHFLQKWTGDCSVCRGPVSLKMGARASMVCWKPGLFLFHCGSPTCIDAVRNHVRQTSFCAVCGASLETFEQKKESKEEASSRENGSKESLTSDNTYEDISQEISDQILKLITRYTQIWLKVLQRKFTIVHTEIDSDLLKNIIIDIRRYLFSIIKDCHATDLHPGQFEKSVFEKMKNDLRLEISNGETDSFLKRHREVLSQSNSDLEKHKNRINMLFVPIYRYMTGQSAKELSVWGENEGVDLFSLYFVFYNDIKLIVGNVLKNDILIKQANNDRKKWLTNVSTEIYPHEFKKGCFIASAVYGSTSAPEVLKLRRFRDDVLLRWTLGKLFVDWYYRVAPCLASRINNRVLVKKFLRYMLFPLVLSANEITRQINSTRKGQTSNSNSRKSKNL